VATLVWFHSLICLMSRESGRKFSSSGSPF